MKTVSCKIHAAKDRKPGKVLRFSDGSLKRVMPNGSLVNVIETEDGNLTRPIKQTKKQRKATRQQNLS